MSLVTRGRTFAANQTILDQADFFQPDGFTRVFGLTIADVTSALFFNNEPQPWILTAGQTVTDAQVVGGKVYFHEIPTAVGYYSVRFRPVGVGYWRLVITYPAGTQIVAQDYDIGTGLLPADTGMKASFIKPTC